MKDYFGNEYVQSSWTRFVWFWQLRDFTARRNSALRVWLTNIEDTLRLAGVTATLDVLLDPNQLSGGNMYGVARSAEGREAHLGLWHYDTLTKASLNPIDYVLAVWRSKPQ